MCPQVRDDVHVAPRYEDSRRADIDEAHRRIEILDLSRVRRGGDHRGEPAVAVRPMHVGKEPDPVPHRHRNVVVAPHAVLRLGEAAVLTAGGLRPVELAVVRCGARSPDSAGARHDFSARRCHVNNVQSHRGRTTLGLVTHE